MKTFENIFFVFGFLCLFLWGMIILNFILALGTDSPGDLVPFVVHLFKEHTVLALVLSIITLIPAGFVLKEMDKI